MVIVPIEKYAALRDFYTKFEAKDQESVVLKPAVAQGSTPAAQ